MGILKQLALYPEVVETAALAYALPRSENVAAVSLLEEAGGPEPLIALAQQMGFDTRTWKAEYGLALPGVVTDAPSDPAKITRCEAGHDA